MRAGINPALTAPSDTFSPQIRSQVFRTRSQVYAMAADGCGGHQLADPPVDDAAATNTEGEMKKLTRNALIAGFGLALLQAHSGTAAAAQCVKVGGVGMGLLEGFASFMAEAAMKNSAKAKLGEAAKIGKVSKKCEWKTVSFECTARAQACK